MTIDRALRLLAFPLVSLAACMSDADFDTRLAALGARIEADAEAARACADGLRRLAERDPVAAASALELQDHPTFLPLAALGSIAPPAPVAAERARAELARREGTIGGDRAALERARDTGPGALDRALGAALQASRVRDRLCRARETAVALLPLLERHRARAALASSTVR